MRPGNVSWSGRDCTVLRSLVLGPRERLVVVRIGAKQLVLGIGSTAISLLCELEEPMAPVPLSNTKFGEAVRKAMERWHRG
jgi:flagellar biogenesis protein FliO